jgi:predicted transcriptional regulator
MSLFSVRTGFLEILSCRLHPGASPLQVLDTTGDIGSMVVAGGVLVLLGLGGVALWRSGIAEALRSDGDATTERADSEAETETAPSAGHTTEPDTDTPGREPSVDDAADSVADDAEGGVTERSDTDIVVDILESNDGRMRQAAIVDETEWSKSKVSMVLSEMEDHGDISKLRVGRENIVSLSGNEPEAAGSPFDEE